MLVFCGAPDGPHYPRNDGRTWTTTAADPYGARVKPAAEGRCDEHGAVALTVPWSDLAHGPDFVVQALIYDDAAPRDKARAGAAVVVRGRGAEAVVLPHAVALLLGPRPLVFGALLLAGVAAARLRRRERAAPRAALLCRALAAALVAATIAGLAVRRDPATEAERVGRAFSRDVSGPDALDRALGPGSAALFDAFAAAPVADGPIVVAAAQPGGLPSAAARYAAARRPHERIVFVDGSRLPAADLVLQLGVAAPPFEAPDLPGRRTIALTAAGRLTTIASGAEADDPPAVESAATSRAAATRPAGAGR